MVLTRPRNPALRPFVQSLWTAGPTRASRTDSATRERVLPTGEMHLVFRLSDHPLRLFETIDDPIGHTMGHAIVGGVRAAFYMRDISEPVHSVGAQLHPSASTFLFGVPAEELTGRHTSLDDLWGTSAAEARERLQVKNPEQQLEILESLLAARLAEVRPLHPAVTHALERFAANASVHDVVREAGWSHRRFIELFRSAMGVTPKVYTRLLRFQRTIRRIAADPKTSCVDVALESGYSDQPHFNREFREFAGITPGEYRALTPPQTHHVPVRSAPRGAPGTGRSGGH
jgi:AraC-like DNA-binding protein